jgi:D-xylose transport system substrate-binding protein
MGSLKRALVGVGTLAVVGASLASSGAALAQDQPCNVGVSWNNFQQERWAKSDKPFMQQTIEAAGGTYMPDFDANLDTDQQITDVQTLIDQGANVLVILAQDLKAIGPALQAAKDAGIPVIAYDRLIEDPDVLYITFNNVDVGTAEAAAILEAVPEGNYVLIKGDPGDPNAASFLPHGWNIAGLQEKIESGEINVVYESFTNAWDTTTAQNNMDAAIQKAQADGVEIDAVLAENDSTALGVVAALSAAGLAGIPVSGQDGDKANLNNVAKGLQYVDVWKDSRELGKAAGAAAIQLCQGVPMDQVTLPEGLLNPLFAPAAGNTASDFTTPGPDGLPESGDENVVVKSLILKPVPLTADLLQEPVNQGWITLEELCNGVTADMPGGAVCAGAAASPAG